MLRVAAQVLCLLPLASSLPWSTPSPPSDWEVRAKGAAVSFATETLQNLLRDNKVVIFSRQSCRASKRVKAFFEDEGIPYYALELDQREDGKALSEAVAERTGSSKTPAVYIQGQLVGQPSVISALNTGELKHWTGEDNNNDMRTA